MNAAATGRFPSQITCLSRQLVSPGSKAVKDKQQTQCQYCREKGISPRWGGKRGGVLGKHRNGGDGVPSSQPTTGSGES